MADLLANLPPVPPSLKSIAPYLQRAEELRTQDPVIAYWCAYYAAQIGITLKARDAASRDLLLALLGALEQTKNEFGSSDAIHIESVSSAYVENFALKVFANADNEDRSAHATRSTAKKFLAAANFLEILKTFPISDISESNEEKIRYAKWKAADIAKAFRERRKPAPGPPGWAQEQEELKKLEQEQEQQEIPSAPTFSLNHSENFPTSDSTSTVAAATSSPYEAPQDRPSSPSSNIGLPHSPPSTLSQIDNSSHHSHLEQAKPGDYASESWSYSVVTTPVAQESPNEATNMSGPDSSLNLQSADLGWGRIESSNWSDNGAESGGGEESRNQALHRSGVSSYASKWSGQDVPSQSPVWASQGSYSPTDVLVEPDELYHGELVNTSSPRSPSYPHMYNTTALQPGPAAYSRPRIPSPPPVSFQDIPVELTPGIIAKAQKHCRFAVSALDYEDAEQAKKELRAALALLGG